MDDAERQTRRQHHETGNLRNEIPKIIQSHDAAVPLPLHWPTHIIDSVRVLAHKSEEQRRDADQLQHITRGFAAHA